MPLSVDKFISTLQSYEVEGINDGDNSKCKKSIALKSNVDSDDADSENDLDDKELALLIKKFIKLNKKGKKFNWKKQDKQNSQKKANGRR